MDNIILIDAWNKDFVLIAVMKGNSVINLFCESPNIDDNVGNIYLGKVVNIVESISAYFIDYGCDKNGFLPFNHCVSELKKDDLVIVQVVKNEKGSKGARLTGFIKIVGTYSILFPYGSVLKRDVKTIKSKINHHNYSDIQKDIDNLQSIWNGINKNITTPVLLYKDHTIINRMIRDKYCNEEVKVIIDSKSTFEILKLKIEQFRSDIVVEQYLDEIPIFHKYRIWNTIKNLTKNNVELVDGGSIVIDSTEAMVCIDVNSASSNYGALENTSYKVNLKAAEEAARQIRLRDLSGIIAIDFIDMQNESHIIAVENIFKENLKYDSSLIKVLPINQFGVLMLSRPRINLNIASYFIAKCEKCHTHINESIQFIAMQIINDIRMNIFYEKYNIKIECSKEVGEYILNELRYILYYLEKNSAKINITTKDLFNQYTISPKSEIMAKDLMPLSCKINIINVVEVKNIVVFPKINNNFIAIYDAFGINIIAN